MNLLIVGTGKGSFEMRAVQVGEALGARVTQYPTAADWTWADLALLIKKHAITYAPQAQRARVPVIWDVLDLWAQPRDNRMSVVDAIALVRQLADSIKPVALIAATRAMADDIGGVYIPHHARIGLRPAPLRHRVELVAYDGSERYLGQWRDHLATACAARGWRFTLDPTEYATADLVVALRDGDWDGDLCRRWKSGVKYVNAICAGRPVITQPAAALDELDLPCVSVTHYRDVDTALDLAASEDMRRAAYANGQQQAERWTLSAVVDQYYRPLLARVAAEVSCAA